MEKGKPKTFKCKSCGGAISIKAVGTTINAVCSHCSSIIDVTDENYKIIDTANSKIRVTLLEIGTRGHLQGKEWEVIGYVEKTDGSGEYRWDEYLLYNPYYGFRFLVQSNGHWNFVKVLNQDIPGAGVKHEVNVHGRKYKIFLKGDAIVAYVKGEFYWRVKVGEKVECIDYIAPPYMLSVEKNKQEINNALGEYLEADTIAKAFRISSEMPLGKGISPNQPGPYSTTFGKIWSITAIAIIVGFVIQIISSFIADNVDVYFTQTYITPDQKGQTFSTHSFSLSKESNVFVQTHSPVQNDWVELELSLVNEQTNQEHPLQQVIEYYYGKEGDENWREGSQTAESYISTQPIGNYRILIEADAGAFQKNLPVSFDIKVKRDVPVWSNLYVMYLLLIIYPLFATFRLMWFEGCRWADSDFAADANASDKEGED